ncbi:hypothetical protein [Frigoribacterium sp. UYMn621]|jgi:hypothetical protein|uniref:hypothetical protein n=1 Tax=Frigoribacterium sp. UYMn621 TaxID=3156343 RepID=UPI0033909B33
MSQVDQLAGKGPLVAVSRATVWVFLALAVAAGLLCLVLGTVGVVTSLVNGTTPLTMALDLPLPTATNEGSATVVSGSYDSASIVVSGLAPGTVALATVARVASVLTQLAISASIAFIAWRLLRGRAFRRSLSLTVAFAGAILLIGGLLSGGLGLLGAWMAADQLVGGVSIGSPWPIIGTVDGTPLGIGVCLLLVGLAFEYGERLQRDTEGLV